MTQRNGLRRRQLSVITATAAVVLALGGLTACEEPSPGSGDDREVHDPEESEDSDDDAADGEEDATDDGADDGQDDGAGSDRDDSGFLGAEETYVWGDGLEITVYAAEEFVPDYAELSGVPYKFQVRVSNSGDAAVEASLLLSARAGEDGVKAERIFDGALSSNADGTVQPGRTLTGEYGFEVPPEADFVDVTVNPLGDYEDASWSLDLG